MLCSKLNFLHFSSYRNEFLLGFNFSFKECCAIKKDLEKLLNYHLKSDCWVIEFFNFEKEIVRFSYTLIQKTKIRKGNNIYNRIIFKAPIVEIFENCQHVGFLKRNKLQKWISVACKKKVNLTHSGILRFYNNKLRFLFTFYSHVNNKKSLINLACKLKHSCALTLALKYKFRHRSKVFKKFGGNLKCFKTGVCFFDFSKNF